MDKQWQQQKSLPSNIPTPARMAYLFPHINNNLIAVSVLCNADCEITFDKNMVMVEHQGQAVIWGWWDTPTGLWHIPLIDIPAFTLPSNQTPEHIPSTSQVVDASYDCSEAKELHQYYHAVFYLPTKGTYLLAIVVGYMQWCIGLSYKGAKCHIMGAEPAMVQGHIKKFRKSIQSSKHTPQQQQQLDSHHLTHMTIFAPG